MNLQKAMSKLMSRTFSGSSSIDKYKLKKKSHQNPISSGLCLYMLKCLLERTPKIHAEKLHMKSQLVTNEHVEVANPTLVSTS